MNNRDDRKYVTQLTFGSVLTPWSFRKGVNCGLAQLESLNLSSIVASEIVSSSALVLPARGDAKRRARRTVFAVVCSLCFGLAWAATLLKVASFVALCDLADSRRAALETDAWLRLTAVETSASTVTNPSELLLLPRNARKRPSENGFWTPGPYMTCVGDRYSSEVELASQKTLNLRRESRCACGVDSVFKLRSQGVSDLGGVGGSPTDPAAAVAFVRFTMPHPNNCCVEERAMVCLRPTLTDKMN